MASLIKAADTRFGHPVFTEWNPLSTQQGSGGRLLSDMPHVDGMLFASISDMESNSTNLVATRNGVGDWSLNRTAAGAETYFVRSNLSEMQLVRTGESQIIDNVIEGPAQPDKGIQVLSMFAVMNIGVVSLTSATLRFGQSVYPLPGAASAAIVQTDIQAATALGTLTATTAGQYLTQSVPVASPVFNKASLTQYEIELSVVMANTGTIRIVGIGAFVNFNFN